MESIYRNKFLPLQGGGCEQEPYCCDCGLPGSHTRQITLVRVNANPVTGYPIRQSGGSLSLSFREGWVSRCEGCIQDYIRYTIERPL